MTYEKKALEIFQLIQELINDPRFQEKFKRKDTYFTRQRKMSMSDVMNFILSLNKGCLSIALEEHMKRLKKSTIDYSNQAFSKARSKIKPEAFLSLLNSSKDKILESLSPKKWYGYRVFAIDGTGLHMPSTKNSKAYWGCRSKAAYQALAGMSVLADVRNNIIHDVEITPWSISETTHAYDLIKRFNTPDSILVFDRGYCNSKMIDLLCERNIKFVIRSKEKIYAELHSSKGKHTAYLSERNFTKPRRLTRYTISTGEGKMYLITNLDDPKIDNLQTMKELYKLRWGIESKYYELKNRINIETVTAADPENVKQDLYAALIFANIVAVFKIECDKKFHKKPSQKYQYQTNMAELIVRMHKAYPCLLLLHRGIKDKLREILRRSIKRGSPIRPDRIVKRSKTMNTSAAKHAHNLKTFL